MWTVSDGTGTTGYGYTPKGWVSGRDRSLTLGSASYTLNYNHNAEGQITAVLYPDNNQASYRYTDGVVSGITLTVNDTTASRASAITYRPDDQVMSGWASGGSRTGGRFTYSRLNL